MSRAERSRVFGIFGAALATFVGAVTFSASGLLEYSPQTEKALQAAIQPALRKVGTQVLRLASQDPQACLTLPAGQNAVEELCVSSEDSGGTAMHGLVDVFMKTVNGAPNPATAFYADVKFNSGISDSSASAGFELVAPAGESHAQDPTSGWSANEYGDDKHKSAAGQGGPLDTADPAQWVLGANAALTSPAITAESIIGAIPSELEIVTFAFQESPVLV